MNRQCSAGIMFTDSSRSLFAREIPPTMNKIYIYDFIMHSLLNFLNFKAPVYIYLYGWSNLISLQPHLKAKTKYIRVHSHLHFPGVLIYVKAASVLLFHSI